MITVDRREVTKHPEIPRLFHLPISVETLEAGDYAFLDYDSNAVAIERCMTSNLVEKLNSGELESQIVKCAEIYSRVILLTEGVYDEVDSLLALYGKGGNNYFRNFVFPKTLYIRVVASLDGISEMGIELMHTANLECTIKAIQTVYERRTKPREHRTLFRKIRPIKIPVKLSANPAVPMLMSLCPRLPEKTAVALIYKYDTIWNVLNADEGELLQIDGFGRGLLSKLKRNVGCVRS